MRPLANINNVLRSLTSSLSFSSVAAAPRREIKPRRERMARLDDSTMCNDQGLGISNALLFSRRTGLARPVRRVMHAVAFGQGARCFTAQARINHCGLR